MTCVGGLWACCAQCLDGTEAWKPANTAVVARICFNFTGMCTCTFDKTTPWTQTEQASGFATKKIKWPTDDTRNTTMQRSIWLSATFLYSHLGSFVCLWSHNCDVKRPNPEERRRTSKLWIYGSRVCDSQATYATGAPFWPELWPHKSLTRANQTSISSQRQLYFSFHNEIREESSSEERDLLEELQVINGQKSLA